MALAEACAPSKETSLTRTGMKLGTAGYMSPEQVRGEPLDARTDIFSFGLVLYEMATGERAFTGETEAILHDAIQHREPTPVLGLAPGGRTKPRCDYCRMPAKASRAALSDNVGGDE